jgi:hypothetical protein
VTQVTDRGRAKAPNAVISHSFGFSKEPTMKSNVGGIDRILRIVIGLVLIGLAATGTVGLWGWIGVVPLATGAIGWCPPYALFGWNTCSMKNRA